MATFNFIIVKCGGVKNPEPGAGAGLHTQIVCLGKVNFSALPFLYQENGDHNLSRPLRIR
jgi:hypothetical protein